jgi:outer membrane protein assembly factor BamB
MKSIFHSLLLPGIIVLLISTTACEAVISQLRSPSERYRLEGDRLLNEERRAEAIVAYRASVDEDPANLTALKSLSALYASQGRRRTALRLLKAAQQLAPTDTVVSSAIELLKLDPAASAPLPLRWQSWVGASEPVGFSLADGRVFVSLEDGTVLAVDGANGTQIWQLKLPDKATSAPAISGDQLFVGAQDGALYALSTLDGAQRWRFSTKAPIYVQPTASGAILYLASGDGTLYALNTAGALQWSFSTGGALHARPTLVAGVLYFGSNDSRMYALDAASGKPLWASGILTQGAVESQAVISGNRVFFGSGDSRVYCLAADSGGEFWRYSTPDAVYAAPLLAGDRLFIASTGNTLTALSPITGKKIWEIKTDFALRDSPLLAANLLFYTTTASPTLSALDPQTGALHFTIDTADWLATAPQSANHTLYLFGKDSTLLAYELEE